MTTPAQRCSLHDARPAFARCMTCTKMLCQECATQWDGIWHCASCLAAKRAQSVRRNPLLSWLAVAAAVASCLYAGARLMVWLGVFVAELL